MATFCILLAAPRSGTTLLGNAVTRTFDAAWPKEIFHEASADSARDFRQAPEIADRANFFHYRYEMLQKQPELSYPTPHNQLSLFRGYLEHLVAIEQAERSLIDIKYTSLHHLNSYWRLPHDCPGVLDIAKQLKLPVVHLKRRNLFNLYCSLAYANATGVWVALDDRTPHKIDIDAAECRKYMTQISATSALVDEWLSGHPVFELEYETMWDGARWSDNVCETFSEIFAMAASELVETPYRKVTPPLSEIVRNADEVLSALSGSPFLAMAEQALSPDCRS